MDPGVVDVLCVDDTRIEDPTWVEEICVDDATNEDGSVEERLWLGEGCIRLDCVAESCVVEIWVEDDCVGPWVVDAAWVDNPGIWVVESCVDDATNNDGEEWLWVGEGCIRLVCVEKARVDD